MAYDPTPIRRDSVITQAAQEICRLVEAERLGPGDALPTETRLAELLGVSRNSVREALRVLHGLGYVEKAAGRRVTVTAAAPGGKGMFDESVMIEAAPIANDVRSHIAQKCAELAAARLSMAELGQMEGALLAPRPRTTISMGCFWPAPATRSWSPCSTRRRARGCRTSRRSTTASTIRATSISTRRSCALCGSVTAGRHAPWCASISRASVSCSKSRRARAARHKPRRSCRCAAAPR